MKLIEVGRDPLQSDVVRVVVERPGQDPVTLLRDGSVWRYGDDGEPANTVFAATVDRLLWLHRREQARKVQEDRIRVERMLGRPGTAHHVSVGYAVDPTKVTREGDQTLIPETALKPVPSTVFALEDAGRLVATSIDDGATWVTVGTSAARDVPPEEYATPREFVERPSSWRQGPGLPLHDGGTLTAEEFAEGAARVESPPGVVLNQRAVETMGVVVVGDSSEVRLHKAVMVALVESPETVRVWGTRDTPAEAGPGAPLLHVCPEASTEGIRATIDVLTAELRRREEG